MRISSRGASNAYLRNNGAEPDELKLTSHIHLATAITGGFHTARSLFPLFSEMCSSTFAFTSPFLAAVAGDFFLSLVFILAGCSLVDLDLSFAGPNHRTSSIFHKFELPVVTCVFSALIGAFAAEHLASPAGAVLDVLLSTMSMMCVGWFFHLCGDFIEGGTGSLFTKGKIGFTWLKWTRYAKTKMGRFIDKASETAAVTALTAATVLLPGTAVNAGVIFLSGAFETGISTGAVFAASWGVWSAFTLLSGKGSEKFVRGGALFGACFAAASFVGRMMFN